MRLIAVIALFLSFLLALAVWTCGVPPLAGFALWMGGFITSELIAWIYKNHSRFSATQADRN